ncbi:MAG: hypothetical protein Q8J76_07900, partial [Desulfobulbaceae bacterium]|nr:hypothetical protein [Desulfobulbaceae bacterium]
VTPLSDILLTTIRDADQARIKNADYLRLFGINAPTITAGELWQHLAEETVPAEIDTRVALDHLLTHGPLARRILKAAGENPDRASLSTLYEQLRNCLAKGEMFA